MQAAHDLEAEQALLGAVMCDNATLERCADLEVEHFYDPVHGRLFAEMRRQARDGAVDMLTMCGFAESDAGVKELGGRAYLMKLAAVAAPLSAQAQAYAAMIRDQARRRACVTEAQAAIAAIQTGADPDDAISALVESVRDGAVAPVASDLADAGEALLLGLDTPLLPTGLRALDRRIGGLARTDLIILAGRPSMGKSAVAGQIARNVSGRGGVVHFASLEMSREQLAARAISAESHRGQYSSEHVPYSDVRAGRCDMAALAPLAARLSRSLIIDDRGAQTLAQLEQAARATRRKHKRLDLIVVDYLQLMRATRRDGRVNEVTEISQGLKAIAKALGCPVLALSQLSRGVESRECKRPTLSDLRDSGAIEQDADVVLACFREAYYLERAEPPAGDEWFAWRAALDKCANAMELLTLKQRSGPCGTDVFDAYMAFDTIRDRRAA